MAKDNEKASVGGVSSGSNNAAARPGSPRPGPSGTSNGNNSNANGLDHQQEAELRRTRRMRAERLRDPFSVPRRRRRRWAGAPLRYVFVPAELVS